MTQSENRSSRTWVRPRLMKLGSSRYVQASKITAKEEKTFKGTTKGKPTS